MRRQHDPRKDGKCSLCERKRAESNLYFCVDHYEEYHQDWNRGVNVGYKGKSGHVGLDLWIDDHFPASSRCPKCEDRLLPDNDYICEACRFG